MMIRFGKLPARVDSIRLKFADVFDKEKLPTPPASFGHHNLMAGGNWHMLGNDKYGDCVFAGAAHEHMLWTMEGGIPRARFTTKDALSDYSVVTGFDSARPDTDQGTDMQKAADYRQKTGIIDATGKRHKIDAYTALRAGDTNQLALAAWMFGAVGVGVQCPASMERQFDQGKPWTVVEGDHILGGHYIPCVGRDENRNFLFITWGKVQAATPTWVAKYMDEGVAYLSLEVINASTKLSPEAFNTDALSKYLRDIA